MKCLILRHGHGEYDDYTEFTDYVLMVPNKFVFDKDYLMEMWRVETFATKKYAGKQTKNKFETISFNDWLASKYEKVEFEESCF
jgi:hypothetical protein